MGQLFIGPAGWSYPDWAGLVYPKPRPRRFHELPYLTQFFNTIEINTTFYRPASPSLARGWISKIAARPEFLFTAKLWQRFTHEAPDWTPDDIRVHLEGLKPLSDARRIGPTLAQFPWSFRDSPENRDRIRRIRDALPQTELVVELRHASWNTPDALRFLAALRIGFCNIDQPPSRGSISRTVHATSPVAYIRLHGRNREAWFNPKAGRDERYNYLYSADELDFWVSAVRQLLQRADQVFVIANNHYQGKAVVNALQLTSILTGKKVQAPSELLRTYDVLLPYVAAPPAERDLFSGA